MKSWAVFLIGAWCLWGSACMWSLAAEDLAAEDDIPVIARSSRTLLQRLAEGESIGMRVDERLGGYALRLTTRKQARRFVEEQATARAESEEAFKEMQQVDEDYQEALRSGRSAEDVVRLERALSDSRRKLESVNRSRSFRYFDLVEVGADHVALKSIDDQPGGMLIPAARIVSVELVETSDEK